MITTGFNTALPGDGSIPTPVAAPVPEQALLIAPAERADVIVDFGDLPNGTRVRMINTAPDGPFGGFPDTPADPLTSGQVMDFIVNTSLPAQPTDTSSTAPENLVLPAEAPLGPATVTRQVSLNEMVSDQVCVEIDGATGEIVGTLFSTTPGDPNFLANCAAATVTPGNTAEPMGPRQARLGILTSSGGNLVATSLRWMDGLTEIPNLNDTEVWEIFNTTMDAHPIHMHLVRFEMIDREDLDPTALAAGNLVPTGTTYPPNPNELGYKDTVIVYPGQMLRLRAKFDIEGLYVWHCHIIEHEDNEMMRPYVVHKRRINADFDGDGKTDISLWNPSTGEWMITPSLGGMMYKVVYGSVDDKPVPADYDGDGKNDIAVWRFGTWFIQNSSDNTQSVVSYGTSGDTPVPGDYDGDGKADTAIWRDGTWFIKNSSDSSQTVESFGTAGDIPVPGDYDGDNKTDMAVWRNGTWFIKNSSNGSQTVESYGTAGDTPVPGDYDSDGKTDFAVWRPSSSSWYIKNSADSTQTTMAYGTTGDIPVPGNYNVITRTDIAVWRPSNSTWYILAKDTNKTRTVTFGMASDLPIKAGQPIQ